MLLLGGVESDGRAGERTIDARHRLHDAEAREALAPVPQLDDLAASGARAGRCERHPRPAACEVDASRDRRATSRVERLPRAHADDARAAHPDAAIASPRPASEPGGSVMSERASVRARRLRRAVQVLGRRLPIDAREHQAADMSDDVRGRRDRERWGSAAVRGIERVGAGEQLALVRGQVDRLQREVREQECEIERWIAEVRDLEVDDPEPRIADEDVLRREVPVHQTRPVLQHRVGVPEDRRGEVAVAPSRLAVVRVDAQLLEGVPLVETVLEPARAPMPTRQQLAQPAPDGDVHVAVEKVRLPRPPAGRRRLDRDRAAIRIDVDHAGRRPGGELARDLERARLGEGALPLGQPLVGDAEPG